MLQNCFLNKSSSQPAFESVSDRPIQRRYATSTTGHSRPLIAIRISVLQYASREFLLERYSAHAVPAEYLRAGPLLNLVSTGSGTLPEALNTSTPVLYLLIHICIGSAYCHAAAAANLRASVLLNFVRNTLKGLLVGLPEWLARKPSCPRAYI